MMQLDLSVLGNFHAQYGTIPLSDGCIERAPQFEGWTENYLDWPKALWDDPAIGVPCQNPEKNALHVRLLALTMRQLGCWIGAPLLLRPPRTVVDANHRLRAVQWLMARGVAIEIPVATDAEAL